MTTDNPRVLASAANIPPFPIGGLKDFKQTEAYLRKLANALASDRTSVGDRVERRVLHGLAANRPTADGSGNVYYSTDTEEYDIDVGTWQNIVTEGGISDHGDLTGLDDVNDHTWAVKDTGDTMTGELVMSGASAYITQASTAPGIRYLTSSYKNLIRGSGGVQVKVGDADLDLDLYGLDARPNYNTSEMAMLSDLNDLEWLQLTDTPASYAGYAGYGVGVNSTPDGLEFVRFVKVAGDTMSGNLTMGTAEVGGGHLVLVGEPGSSPSMHTITLGKDSSDRLRTYNNFGYVYLGVDSWSEWAEIGTDATEGIMFWEPVASDKYYLGVLGTPYVALDGTTGPVKVGNDSKVLDLRGSATRPTYKGGDLALLADVSGYLPLSAGPSYPLTGDLYFADTADAYFTNDNGIYLQENVGYTYIKSFYMGPASNDINVGNLSYSMRLKGDETRPKYNNNDLALLTDAGGGPGTDTTAIHDNVPNEITAITAKSPPLHGADEIIIEDSNASYAKKAVTFTNLAGFVLDQENGPFLPLTAGGSYPLTGHLYVESAADPTIFLREGGDTVNYGRIVHSATSMYFDSYRASGNSSILYFRAFTGAVTDASYIRFNYGVNAQACYYQFYGPNGTAEVTRITGTASNSGYVTAYANGGTASLQAWWDSSNYCALQTISASTTYLRRYGTASPTIQIFCTAIAGTENCAVGIGYATNTTGTNRLLLYDNATVIHEFDLNSGDIDLCKTGGTLCVGDYDHELHTTGNADLCQNGGKLMVNTADLATMVSTTLEVGDTSLTLNLQGAGSRPQFEGSALALYSDLSSSPSVHDPDAIHYNETFEFSEASYLAGANIADLDIILLEDSGTKKYTTFEDIGIYLNNTYAQFLNRYGDVNPGMLGVLSFETYSASVGGIRMKDSSNNWRTVAHMNTATMYLGTTACNLEIEAGTYLDMTATYTRVFGGFGATGEVEHQGNVTLFNNKFFRVQNTPGGTAYNVIGMNGSNQVQVGNSTYTMYLYSSGASFQCSVDVNGTLHVTNDLHVFQTLEIDGTAQFDSTTTFNSFIIQEYNKNFSIKDSGGTARGVMVVTGSNFRLGYDTLMTSIRGIGGGTSSPFSSGHWGIWKKSSDNTVWLVYNDGGTAKMVELTSTPHAEGI